MTQCVSETTCPHCKLFFVARCAPCSIWSIDAHVDDRDMVRELDIRDENAYYRVIPTYQNTRTQPGYKRQIPPLEHSGPPVD